MNDKLYKEHKAGRTTNGVKFDVVLAERDGYFLVTLSKDKKVIRKHVFETLELGIERYEDLQEQYLGYVVNKYAV